jgi:hypothetical protein
LVKGTRVFIPWFSRKIAPLASSTRGWSYGSWIYNYLCNRYLSPLSLNPTRVRSTRYNHFCSVIGGCFLLPTFSVFTFLSLRLSTRNRDKNNTKNTLYFQFYGTFTTTYAIDTYHHWVWIPLEWGLLVTTLYDKVCQCLATGLVFSGFSGFLYQ